MSSAADHTLVARFDQVRDRLLQDRYADRLSKPLEFWVLPSDRRLPLALLGRTLQDLLATPFDELSATPGIGEKKIHSLVKLLDRATSDEPPMVSVGGGSSDDEQVIEHIVPDRHKFDPQVVSEALWTEWRELVRRYQVEDQQLGYLAPSLQLLPTVIWQTPLRQYLDHTLAEIRRLRTHGEKRVRCVLEVFHSVYYRLEDVEPQDRSRVQTQLTPPWIRSVEDWVQERLRMEQEPGEAEVKRGFVSPMLQLIEVDCGPTVARLVRERLGLEGPQCSVREQARELKVTRARIYQLLDDCGKVMTVRWPQGRQSLDQLSRHFSNLDQRHDGLHLFYNLAELCFPGKQSEERLGDRASVLAARRPEPQERDAAESETLGTDQVMGTANRPGFGASSETSLSHRHDSSHPAGVMPRHREPTSIKRIY